MQNTKQDTTTTHDNELPSLSCMLRGEIFWKRRDFSEKVYIFTHIINLEAALNYQPVGPLARAAVGLHFPKNIRHA